MKGRLTSSSSMSLSPFLNSSSMLSMRVPALRRCELHQAVKVWKEREKVKHENDILEGHIYGNRGTIG